MSQYQDLQAKLRLLYDSGLASAIDSHSKLAQELGIRRQNVNKWINGADGYSPGTIPRGRATAIAGLFSIEFDWLALPLAEFAHHVARRAESRRQILGSTAVDQLIPSSMQRELPLFGREDLLTQLTFAWTRVSTRVAWLEGFGGSGKTALLASWLEELAVRGYDGVFAWRFDDHSYTSPAEAEKQLFDALGDYLGLRIQGQESPEQRVERYARRIAESRLLLLIDGVPETQGVSSHSLLAPLISVLSEHNPGLLVVSSTASLEDFTVAANSAVSQLSVDRLSPQAGVELLEAQGVNDHWNAREEIVTTLAGHPLALVYAAGRLAGSQAQPVDVLSPAELLASVTKDSPSAAKSRRLDAIASAVHSRMRSESASSLFCLLCLLDTPISVAQLMALCSWAR